MVGAAAARALPRSDRARRRPHDGERARGGLDGRAARVGPRGRATSSAAINRGAAPPSGSASATSAAPPRARSPRSSPGTLGVGARGDARRQRPRPRPPPHDPGLRARRRRDAGRDVHARRGARARDVGRRRRPPPRGRGRRRGAAPAPRPERDVDDAHRDPVRRRHVVARRREASYHGQPVTAVAEARLEGGLLTGAALGGLTGLVASRWFAPDGEEQADGRARRRPRHGRRPRPRQAHDEHEGHARRAGRAVRRGRRARGRRAHGARARAARARRWAAARSASRRACSSASSSPRCAGTRGRTRASPRARRCSACRSARAPASPLAHATNATGGEVGVATMAGGLGLARGPRPRLRAAVRPRDAVHVAGAARGRARGLAVAHGRRDRARARAAPRDDARPRRGQARVPRRHVRLRRRPHARGRARPERRHLGNDGARRRGAASSSARRSRPARASSRRSACACTTAIGSSSRAARSRAACSAWAPRCSRATTRARTDTLATLAGSMGGLAAATARADVHAARRRPTAAPPPTGAVFGAFVGALVPTLDEPRWHGLDHRKTGGGLLLGLSARRHRRRGDQPRHRRLVARARPHDRWAASTGSPRASASACSLGDDTSSRPTRVGVVAGTSAGLALGGARRGRGSRLGPGDAAMIDASRRRSARGRASGCPTLGHASTTTSRPRRRWGGLLAGAGLASIGASLLAPDARGRRAICSSTPSRVDALWTAAGAGAGALVSTRDDAPVWGMLGAGTAGLVLGGALHRSIAFDEHDAPFLAFAGVEGAWLGGWIPSLHRRARRSGSARARSRSAASAGWASRRCSRAVDPAQTPISSRTRRSSTRCGRARARRGRAR